MTARISDLASAARWLESLINLERLPDFPSARLDLAPIQSLLARLDAPDAGLSLLHVAGSKGKGSTALLAESLLGAPRLAAIAGAAIPPHWANSINVFALPR